MGSVVSSVGNAVGGLLGGGSSAPAAPNYTAAAQATAQGNLENAKLAQVANMVNQYTPQGSVVYKPVGTVDGNTQWGQTVTMAPEQQKLYDQAIRVNQGLGDVSEQGLGYVQSALDKPLQSPGQAVGTAGTTQFQTGVNAPTLQTQMGQTGNIQQGVADNSGQLRTSVNDPNLINQQVQDALYQSQTQYLDPQFTRSQARLENQLANQGITRGSEAWNNAMQEANAQKQQAYESARNSAISGATNAASTLYGNQLAGMNAQNTALGQQFGQGVTAGQFTNQAQQQQYQQQLAQMQAQNEAQGQQFNMGISNANLANQAAQQQYAQQLSNAQLQNQAINQNFANAQTLRQDPINMLNAVRSGQQMTAGSQPQVAVSAPGMMGTVAGADLLGATQAGYNAQLGAYNAQNAATSGMLGGLGSLAMGGYGLSKIK